MVMDRRKSLKTLLVGSVATGLVINGCKVDTAEKTEEVEEPIFSTNGQTPEEIKRDEMLLAGPDFFNAHEFATLTVLSDLIIPPDDKSAGASEAEVPQFIDFIMRDVPSDQTLMRGGLKWLDHQCLREYEQLFKDCSQEQQKKMLDLIAYPEEIKPEHKFGGKWFNLLRNLVATGFFTSRIGIKDLGYVGNRPNVWNGVPDDVLKEHGLDYNNKWKDLYVTEEDRESIVVWDTNE